MRRNKRPMPSEPEQAAGNGVLDRRLFLTGGAAAAIGSAALPDNVRAAEALPVEPWMKTPGSPFVPYGQPSKYTGKVARIFASVPGTTGTGTSRTPHHLLDGSGTAVRRERPGAFRPFGVQGLVCKHRHARFPPL